MNQMFIVGTICWCVAGFFGLLFQYECLKVTTPKGIVWKSIAAFSVVAYAIILIKMFGHSSDAAMDYVAALVFVTLADIVLAYVEYKGNGTSESFLMTISGGPNSNRYSLIIAGALFIFSYFFQTVAFIKGISQYANVSDYAVPFLVLLLVPPLFTVIGGLLAQFRIPDADIKVFIVGAFYILLASASFSASTLFAFALFQNDMLHALWVFVGGVLFFLAMLLMELRYSRPKMYDNIPVRVASRLLTFIGRLMLAGCAFLL